MTLCKDCKHWEDGYLGKHYCGLVSFREGVRSRETVYLDPPDGVLYTPPGFGCVLGEPKPPAPKGYGNKFNPRGICTGQISDDL